MKNSIYAFAVAAAMFAIPSFADGEVDSKKGTLSFSLSAALSYRPAPNIKRGASHFSGVDDWSTSPIIAPLISLSYSKPIICGDVPQLPMLAVNATLGVMDTGLSVTARPIPHFPLLNFASGANIMPSLGIDAFDTENAVYDARLGDYRSMSGALHFFYSTWIKTGFDFDFSLILPEHFPRIVLSTSARLSWVGLTGAGKGDLWRSMFADHQTNGFKYDLDATLACMLPYRLNLLGLQFNMNAYLKKDYIDDCYSDFDLSFPSISFAAITGFQIGKKSSLVLSMPLQSRRSFSIAHESVRQEPLLKTSGREWYFGGLQCMLKITF